MESTQQKVPAQPVQPPPPPSQAGASLTASKGSSKKLFILGTILFLAGLLFPDSWWINWVSLGTPEDLARFERLSNIVHFTTIGLMVLGVVIFIEAAKQSAKRQHIEESNNHGINTAESSSTASKLKLVSSWAEVNTFARITIISTIALFIFVIGWFIWGYIITFRDWNSYPSKGLPSPSLSDHAGAISLPLALTVLFAIIIIGLLRRRRWSLIAASVTLFISAPLTLFGLGFSDSPTSSYYAFIPLFMLVLATALASQSHAFDVRPKQ